MVASQPLSDQWRIAKWCSIPAVPRAIHKRHHDKAAAAQLQGQSKRRVAMKQWHFLFVFWQWKIPVHLQTKISRKLALVGIIPNQILFFVGAERENNLITKISRFTTATFIEILVSWRCIRGALHVYIMSGGSEKKTSFLFHNPL